MKTAEERGIQVPAPQGFRGIPGRGVVAMVDGVVDFKDKGRLGRYVSVTPGPRPGSEAAAAS